MLFWEKQREEPSVQMDCNNTWDLVSFEADLKWKTRGSCPSCFPLRLPVQKVLASSVAPVRVEECTRKCTRTSEEYWLFPQATIVVLIYMDGGQRVLRLSGFLTSTTVGSRYVKVSVLHQSNVRFKWPVIIVLLLSHERWAGFGISVGVLWCSDPCSHFTARRPRVELFCRCWLKVQRRACKADWQLWLSIARIVCLQVSISLTADLSRLSAALTT